MAARLRFACLALLALLALAACSAPKPETPVLVQVDGVGITQADLDLEIRLRAWGAKEEPGPKELLEGLIDRTLILNRGRALGLKVTGADLEKVIREASQDYTPGAFKAALAEKGISLDDWQEALKRRLLIQKTVEAEVGAKTGVSDAEIKDHYWEHLSDYRLKERLKIRQIVTREKTGADKALQEILLGLPFAEAARKYSVTPEGPSGGDLGAVSRAELPTAVARVAFNLKKGRPSGVFKSPYGFHVLLVESSQPSRLMSLEEAGPLIRSKLLEQKQHKPYQEWLLRLRQQAKVLRSQVEEEKP